MTFEEILNIQPFSLDEQKKEKVLTERLVELTRLHEDNCPEYKQMLEASVFDLEAVKSYKELPFLPVRLFKELDLKSVP